MSITQGVWLTANLVTAAAYMAIPIELMYWRRRTPLSGAQAVMWLFCGFILLCGMHHLTMPFLGHLRHFHMIPFPMQVAQAVIDTATALISVATHYVVYRNRALIVKTLEALQP